MEAIAEQILDRVKTSKFGEYIEESSYKESRAYSIGGGGGGGRHMSINLKTKEGLPTDQIDAAVHEIINGSFYQVPRLEGFKTAGIQLEPKSKSGIERERLELDKSKLVENIKSLTEIDLSIIPENNYFRICLWSRGSDSYDIFLSIDL